MGKSECLKEHQAFHSLVKETLKRAFGKRRGIVKHYKCLKCGKTFKKTEWL